MSGGEMSVGNCPGGELSVVGKCPVAKCPGGEMSGHRCKHRVKLNLHAEGK